MSIALETTLSNIKPLDGAKVRRYLAGAAISPGHAVYISAAGTVSGADSDAVATNYVVGVALAPRNQATAYAAGDMVDVVTFGPVQCVTGATAGSIIYTSGTAGVVAESTGTKTSIVGVAESATVVFVNPQIVSLS